MTNGNLPVDPEAPLSREKRVGFAIEAWKKTVDVQQHFNDLGLRIRNLAITVLGAVFSVAGIILKDARESNLPGWVVLAGAVLCGLFYFMDAGWYHRLLKGSVTSGATLETFITQNGVPINLGTSISTASAFPVPFLRTREMHSREKLHTFWLILLGVTIAFAVALFHEADKARDLRAAKETATADSLAAVVRRNAASDAVHKDSVAAATRADSLRRVASASQKISRRRTPPARR
jgi:hypothetical protein